MRIAIALTLSLFARVAVCQEGQEKKKPAAPVAARMASLSWLIGTWQGKSAAPEAKGITFKYTFEWTLNRHFIKNHYWTMQNGKVIWHDTGLIGWNKKDEKFVSFNFGMDGSIGRASEIASSKVGLEPAPTVLLLEGSSNGHPMFQSFRWMLRKIDTDTLEIAMYAKRGGKFVQLDKSRAKRSKAKK